MTGHCWTGLGDHTRDFTTEVDLARVHAQGVQDVPEVQPGGADGYPDFARTQVARLDGGEDEVVDGPAFGDVQPPGAFRNVEPGVHRRQPWCEGGVPAHRDLRFPRGEGSVDIFGWSAVDEDDPAGVLGLGGAHQAPDGGRGRVDVVTGRGADGVGGADHQEVPAREPSLQSGQQSIHIGRSEHDVVRRYGLVGDDRDPVDAVEVGDLGQAPGGSGGHALDGDGHLTGRVDRDDGDPAAGRGRDTGTQLVRAGGAKGDSGPGERDTGLAVPATGGDGLEGSVEQGRVHEVAAFVGGQLDEGVLAAHPHRADRLEHRAVRQSGGGEAVVDEVGVDGVSAQGRPLREVVLVGLGGRGENAGGVAGPVLAFKSRMDCQRVVDR
ncbi:hypothetical protein GCM10010483_01550 [Actinokineospora diospyrosa]